MDAARVLVGVPFTRTLRWLAAAALFLSLLISWAAAPARAEVVVDLAVIGLIESANDPSAFNAATRCYGQYQISEICLQEYNQINSARYATRDLFDPAINEKIATWYFKRIGEMLVHYRLPVNLTTVLASYNWGIGRVLTWHRHGAFFDELPSQTQRYIRTYERIRARG